MWKDILNKTKISLCAQQNSFIFFSFRFSFVSHVEPCACLLWNFPVMCMSLCWYFALKRTTHPCIVHAKMKILTLGSKRIKEHRMSSTLATNHSNVKKNYWLWLFFAVSGYKLQSGVFFLFYTVNQSIDFFKSLCVCATSFSS